MVWYKCTFHSMSNGRIYWAIACYLNVNARTADIPRIMWIRANNNSMIGIAIVSMSIYVFFCSCATPATAAFQYSFFYLLRRFREKCVDWNTYRNRFFTNGGNGVSKQKRKCKHIYWYMKYEQRKWRKNNLVKSIGIESEPNCVNANNMLLFFLRLFNGPGSRQNETGSQCNFDFILKLFDDFSMNKIEGAEFIFISRLTHL